MKGDKKTTYWEVCISFIYNLMSNKYNIYINLMCKSFMQIKDYLEDKEQRKK